MSSSESLRERESVYSSAYDLGSAQHSRSWSPALRSAGLGAAALLYAAALVFLRGRPTINSDAGIFLSVASRLSHGAHLYTGVWDNKPPFFYYAQALAVGVAGWRGPFLLDAVWLFIAAVSMWLLLGAVRASTGTRVVGAVLYPVFLTGAWYLAGYSELPPLALATTMAWLGFRGNMLAAGAVLGIVAFFRLDYGLVFLSLIAVAMIIGAKPDGTLIRRGCRLLVGFVTVAAASVAVLAARDELTGYLSTIRSQVGYPNRALAWLREPAGVAGHVNIVGHLLVASRLRTFLFVLVVAALVVILIGGPLRQRLRGRTRTIRMAPLDVLCLSTAAAVAVTLALTALWRHGLEMIALPATFGACVLVSRLQAALRSHLWRIAMTVATAAVCSVAFGGLLPQRSGGSPGANRQPLSAWWRSPHSVTAAALNTEAADVRRSAAAVTYARLGLEGDGGYAEFLHQDLELACPQFHQYPFSAPNDLNQTLACVRDRLPTLVVVTPRFHTHSRASAQIWNSFVLDSKRLLRSHYRKSLVMSYHRRVAVWVRR